jgi:hypothetical protein
LFYDFEEALCQKLSRSKEHTSISLLAYYVGIGRYRKVGRYADKAPDNNNIIYTTSFYFTKPFESQEIPVRILN